LSEWYLEKGAIKDARKHVAKSFRYAKQDFRPHTLAVAFRAIGKIHYVLREYQKTLKYFWKSINFLCMEEEICFFCLARSFTGAALAHWALHECTLARDRLGKALSLGLTIPSRSIQKDALRNLAVHFETHADYYNDHEERKRAVAAYVWYVKVAKELDPEDSEADLNVLLRDIMVKIGRDKTYALYLSVRDNAKEIVLEALSGYKLEEFISGIGAKASPHGDHW
jgi:tetratricopeptide (TPR) repeat protein